MCLQEFDDGRAVLLRPGGIHGDAVELIRGDHFHCIAKPIEALVQRNVRIGHTKNRPRDRAAFQRGQARCSAARDDRHSVILWKVKPFAFKIFQEDRRRAAAQGGHTQPGSSKVVEFLVRLAAHENVRRSVIDSGDDL